jgi:hypothetical protein
MPETRRQELVPAGCALLAAVLVAIAAVPSLRPAGWSLTVLPRVDAATGMGAAARQLDPGFRTVHPAAYDGQFYWGIAVDPIATGRVHEAFDKPTYRYGHPLYGWLGWLFSAGQARAVPAALFVVGLVSIAAAAAAAALLGVARGRRGWEGLVVALNPGLVYAGVHDLAEPLSAALLLASLAAFVRGRRPVALACLALLPLTKEPLAVWELVRNRRRLLDVVPIVATVLPTVVWWTYTRLHLGAWFTTGDTALASPLSGWKRALLDAGVHSYSPSASQSQASEATIVVLVVLLAALGLGTLAALRLRGPVDLVFLPLAVLAACLAANATVYLRDALRNTGVLLVLVPFVTASPPPLPTSREGLAGGSSTRRPRSRT